LVRRYQGNHRLALAAYNVREDDVDRHGGLPAAGNRSREPREGLFSRRKGMKEQLYDRNCAIWECTEGTFQECLDRNLFGEADRSPRLQQSTRPAKGDVCFLLNLDNDTLSGVFVAETDIGCYEPEAWGGRFKAQIRVRPLGRVQSISDAQRKLQECGVRMKRSRGRSWPLHFVHPPAVTQKLLDLFPDDALAGEIVPPGPDDRRGSVFPPTEGLDGVAGLDPVKRFIRERMVEPLLHPALAARYRLRVGGGVLLFGPPGTGKTRIAKATAAELEAEFLEVTPSVIRGYPGDAEQRLEEIFGKALQSPRVVIFLDEAEALLAPREKQNSTVMQRITPVLLGLFSRVSARRDRPVLIVSATNQPWEIDRAFLRPGRLDVQLFVGPPDLEARKKLILMNMEGRPHEFDEDSIHRLAKRLEGWTGADIEALLDQAARECYRQCPKPGDEDLPDDRLVPIRPGDVEALADRKRPSVTPDELQRYYEWDKQHGTKL
jgi:transitional endoplasmic reticulum ATPase